MLTAHSLAVFVYGHARDALLSGDSEVGPVVSEETDGDVGVVELVRVPLGGQSDEAIVVVVGRLGGLPV